MSTQLDYGKRITISDANEIIGEYSFLKRHIQTTLDPALVNDPGKEDDLYDRAKLLMLNQKNAFIFERKKIKEFLDEHDKAEFLVVILGTHPQHNKMQTQLILLKEIVSNPVVLLSC